MQNQQNVAINQIEVPIQGSEPMKSRLIAMICWRVV